MGKKEKSDKETLRVKDHAAHLVKDMFYFVRPESLHHAPGTIVTPMKFKKGGGAGKFGYVILFLEYVLIYSCNKPKKGEPWHNPENKPQPNAFPDEYIVLYDIDPEDVRSVDKKKGEAGIFTVGRKDDEYKFTCENNDLRDKWINALKDRIPRILYQEEFMAEHDIAQSRFDVFHHVPENAPWNIRVTLENFQNWFIIMKDAHAAYKKYLPFAECYQMHSRFNSHRAYWDWFCAPVNSPDDVPSFGKDLKAAEDRVFNDEGAYRSKFEDADKKIPDLDGKDIEQLQTLLVEAKNCATMIDYFNSYMGAIYRQGDRYLEDKQKWLDFAKKIETAIDDAKIKAKEAAEAKAKALEQAEKDRKEAMEARLKPKTTKKEPEKVVDTRRRFVVQADEDPFADVQLKEVRRR